MATLPTIEDIIKWPLPNYVDPVTRRPLVLGVEIPMTILPIIFTAGRFYSRTVIVKALGWDDWFMLMATVQNPHLQFGKRSFSGADSICGRFSRQRRT
jgi:hypothetical protein